MIGKMGEHEDDKLPQDDVDGVDSDEWVGTCYIDSYCIITLNCSFVFIG